MKQDEISWTWLARLLLIFEHKEHQMEKLDHFLVQRWLSHGSLDL